MRGHRGPRPLAPGRSTFGRLIEDEGEDALGKLTGHRPGEPGPLSNPIKDGRPHWGVEETFHDETAGSRLVLGYGFRSVLTKGIGRALTPEVLFQ